MCDYLTTIQSACDSLTSYSHPIEEMKHIFIVLNGVKGQCDNVIVVIHANRNLYDIASMSSVLLNGEARQSDLLLMRIFQLMLM